jgi:RNA polymerase sigma-70 factor (ECF subfamily)
MRDAGVIQSTLAMVLPATRVQSEAPLSKVEHQVRPESVEAAETSDTLALISLARGGDMAAFDQLMRLHERLVLMSALRFLNGNLADAQDAAQTVFLRLHRSLGQFRSAASFTPWLYRITVNVCHDMNRKKQRRAEVDLATVVRVAADARQNSPDHVDEEERQMEAIRASLGTLGEKEREAIVLRDIQGLETSEVAAILGSSEATVRSQISVGRRKIRKFVETYMKRRP